MSRVQNPANWIWAIRSNKADALAHAVEWITTGSPIYLRALRSTFDNIDRLERELLEWCEK